MDNERELKELWENNFSHEQSEFTPEKLVQGEQKWREQRCVHLPLTLNVMLENVASLDYGRRGQADGERVLLLMVGFSEEQLALSIAAHVQRSCKKIVPFSSLTVGAYMQSGIVDCLRDLELIEMEDYCFEPLQEIEPNNPANVFQKIMHWVRDNPDRRPAIECTGGQKPMDSGASYAASFYGLPAYYLDFEKYDRQLRKPKPWTCRYHKLELPDAAFSLSTRSSVRELFKKLRFQEAHELLQEIVNAPLAAKYLEEEDHHDLNLAIDQFLRCNHCIQFRYEEDLLSEHKLHACFKKSRDTKMEPRKIVEELLKRNNQSLLFEYVIDEYWRLYALRDKGEHREAIIGCVGLIELVVDSLFYLPWFDRVEKEPPNSLPPEGHQRKKFLFLWNGKADFTRRSPRIKLKCDPPALKVPVDEEQCTALRANVWDKYASELCIWTEARHALAHVRVPFVPPDTLNRALNHAAPRFIELLFRMQNMGTAGQVDISQSAEEEWITWWTKEEWKQEKRAPWFNYDQNITKWLRLPIEKKHE